MSNSEIESLVTRYMRDPSVVYDYSERELRLLMSAVGEEEPIVDAILALGGAGDAARAEALGMTLEEWRSYQY